MQKLLQNETTDEHGAAEPQPKKSRRRRVRTLPGNLRVLCGREKKCIAGFQPAKVVLTQKELSRLRCRRDAGATIFSRDPCLRGETGRLATAGSLSESQPRSARDGVELPPRPVRGAGVHVGLQGEVPIACSLERKRYCIL